MSEELQNLLSQMTAGRPVVLRSRLMRGNFAKTRRSFYPLYSLTLPRAVVEALGWKPGLRIVPYYSPELGVIVLFPSPISPPE